MIGLLLRKTRRDLGRSAAQTVALVVIVALGVASLVALIGAYRDLGRSYDDTYARLHFADVTFSVASAPEEVVGQIEDIGGVSAVTGRLIVDTGMVVPGNDGGSNEIRARLIGVPGDRHPAVDDVLVTNGSYLSSAGGEQSALVEQHFAKVYGLRPGDAVQPIVEGVKTPIRIAGVVASPEYLIVSASRQDVIPSARTFGVIYLPLSRLQAMTASGKTVDNIAIRIAPGADAQRVVADVSAVLQPFGLSDVELRKDQPSNEALRLDLEGYREIGILMPALILLASAASLFVMLGRQIRAQQPQIGLMKALGYGRGAVVLHILSSALAISVVGSIVGIVAGSFLGHAATAAYAAELGIPFVRSRFYVDLALIGLGVTVAVGAAAGIVPALRASQLAPAAAMRPDPARAAARGKRTWLERLLPRSVWLLLPARNVFRVRSRSLSTAVGIIFAFILVLTSWSLIGSLHWMTEHNFRDIEQWDLYAVFDQPKTMGSFSDISSLPGVTEAEPALQVPATLRLAGAPGGGDNVYLTAMRPASSMHRLQLSGKMTPVDALAAGSVVITSSTAEKLGLAIGARVKLVTPFGVHEATVGGISNELVGASVYASLQTVESWVPFHAEIFNAAFVKAQPASVDALKSAIYHIPGAASVQVKSNVEADWQSLMGLFYVFMGVLFAFSIAMAFALLFNAMTVNVLEQLREFATMRSIGTSGARVAGLMTTENIMLWILTLIPGLVLGSLAAHGMGRAFNSELFSFTIVVGPAAYIVTALAILATMVLAALPAVRRINRLNLAEATKVLT